VPQNVRRQSFSFQGRTFANGSGNVLIEDMLKARACKGLGARIEEQLRNARVASNGKPRSQAACNSFPEGKDALLPPFSHHMDIDIAARKLEMVVVMAPFDIFRVDEPDGMLWIEAAAELEAAKARVGALMQTTPCEYLISSSPPMAMVIRIQNNRL
jgi:hypothetical protein